MTPTIELHDERGHIETILEPTGHGPVDKAWWPVLNANDICTHCLYMYDDCICPEANEDH